LWVFKKKNEKKTRKRVKTRSKKNRDFEENKNEISFKKREIPTLGRRVRSGNLSERLPERTFDAYF
jgi:hypothetical protein